MRLLGQLLSVAVWLLVAGSVIVLTGGLFGRPLLLAAVPTGSMVPVLQPGDLIVVLPTWAVLPPGLGDIVVYKTPKDRDWIVHRIIDGNETEGFTTKGDANQTADPHRVFSRDIAGVVPRWGEGALRLPHLGMLSIADGPFSSPVVAGVALVMGVYLLILDVKPRIKLPHLHTKRTVQSKPEAVLSMYLGLAGTVFLTTLIPAWTMTSRQPIHYEVVAQKPSNIEKVGLYLQGQAHTEDVPIRNPSPLPLVVVVTTDDPHIHQEPWWALITGGEQQVFQIVVETPATGTFEATMHTGVFVPMMPPVLLAWAAHLSIALAAVLNALVPSVLILSMALLDVRSRSAISRFRTRVGLRLMP